MSELINEIQFAVKGRDVTNGLILARDILSYLKDHDHEANLISVHLYKAFDCVDHCFLRKIMEKFGFASHFCNYVFNLVQNGQASVIVNGFISESFEVYRGVRQGDPLSLHLFLHFLEPILTKINEDVHIEGIYLPGSKRTIAKYFAYADDVTFIMADARSVNRMLHLFKEYTVKAQRG